MMSLKGPVLLAGIAIALSQAPQIATGQGKGAGKGHGGSGQAQGKGQGKGHEKSQGKGQPGAQGKSGGGNVQRGQPGEAHAGKGVARGIGKTSVATARSKPGNGRSKFTRTVSISSMPQSVRRFGMSRRSQDVIVAAAVSHAFARGRGDEFRIEQVGDGVRLANLSGDRLLFLDDESARNLGRWRVGVLNDDVRDGAPSFCRSGAGHPVWGRQWCLDKGFGLGSYQDFGWGRTNDLGDIVFPSSGIGGTLAAAALATVLGPTAFNRLALHAVTLGLVQPLTGMWVSQPTGPQLLRVNSGLLPVAEFEDVNRDNRADDLLVALRSW